MLPFHSILMVFSFVDEHLVHHILILIDDCLCLKLLESNDFVPSKLIILYSKSCGHNHLSMCVETAFVEVFGLKVEILDGLEAFKLICIPQWNLPINWYTYELTLLIEKEQLHKFVIVDLAILRVEWLAGGIVDHDVTLLATNSEDLLLLTKGRTHYRYVFWFVISTFCHLYWRDTFLMPLHHKVHWLIHPKEAIIKRDKCANVIIKW